MSRRASAVAVRFWMALEQFVEAVETFQEKSSIEKRLQTAMAAAFVQQADAFEAAAGQAAEGALVPPPANVFDSAVVAATTTATDAMATAIQAAAEDAMRLGATATLSADVGISFDLSNPRAVAYLKDYGAARVSQISETTREIIKGIVTRGVEDGWSYDQIAKAIKEKFEEFAAPKPQQHIDSRAHLVAVTEVGNAYEEGNLIGAQTTGTFFPMEKSWLTVGDSRVSAGCRGNEAEGWIAIDDEFPSGHQRPLRFPGCRCTALYRRALQSGYPREG